MSLFGGFGLYRDGELIPIKNRKAQALLAYLVLSSSPSEPRERLCGLLWSENPEDKARASLRQTLHSLHEIFDAAELDHLVVTREAVRLTRASLDVDVWSVLDQAERLAIHPLLLEQKRVTESLLPGFEDLDPSFRVWLLVQRQSHQERLQRHLERALGRLQQDPALAKAAATALINLDPTHEEACRALMDLAAARGDTAGALKIYKTLWDLLEEDYDTEPSEVTKDLVVRIKRGGAEMPPAVPPPPAQSAPAPGVAEFRPGDHTLLFISEFDSRGVEERLSHLVYGLRHDLIAKLVRFREWSVIDGIGTAGDVDLQKDQDSIRRFQIDATLRQTDTALTLILTIKEQPSGRYVWSHSFSLGLERWFEIQQAVVGRIALALNVQLSTERLMTTARRPAISLGAYDQWLKGQELALTWWGADEWREAARIFQSIIQEAPNFSPAYSSLVALKNSEHLSFPGVFRSAERDMETGALAKMAVQTDPFDSRAHLAMAWCSAMRGQFEQAELSFGLALDLNENDPWTLISSALGLGFCGEGPRAQALADKALLLNASPSRSHWAYQATVRFMSGDYGGCIEAAHKAEDVILNLPAWNAAALSHAGSDAAAEREAERFLDLIRRNWCGHDRPTDLAITSWFLTAFPIRAEADWERVRKGLERAGLPCPAESISRSRSDHDRFS
jgi:DNA-binding SARP family transcriptional activator/TolB-like protein